MKKKIISVLLSASMISIVCPVNAGNSGLVENITFENFEENITVSTVQTDFGTLRVNTSGKSTASVVTDEIMGSKALRISKGTDNGTAYVGYAFNNAITSGLYDIYVDVRIPHAEAQVNKFIALCGEDGTGTTIASVQLYGEGMMINSTSALQFFPDLTDGEKYTYHYIINADDKVVDLDIIKDGTIVRTYKNIVESQGNKNNFINRGIKNICFNIQNPNPGSNWFYTWDFDTKAGLKDDTVIYIDNILVKRSGLAVVSTVPDNKSDIVEIDDNIRVVFNAEIDSNDIDKNISVYENGKEITSDRYKVNCSRNTIEITFDGNMEYNTEYKVEYSGNLKSVVSGYTPLTDTYIFDYKTKRLFDMPEGLKDGGQYTEGMFKLPENDDVEITAVLENANGEKKDYLSNYLISEKGTYILTITGVSKLNGKIQEDIYNFEVVGQQVPQAQNVLADVKGEFSKTAVLCGAYTYYDINEYPISEEGESVVQWYRSDNKDYGFEKIPGADSLEYTLTENDTDKYFKFSVIPVSLNEPFKGEEVFSDIIMGYFLPQIKDIKIIGSAELGSELIAEYTYYDPNSYVSESSVNLQWYRSADGGKTFEKSESGNETKYVLTEKDKDCLMRIGIIPIKDGNNGKEYFSESIKGPSSPKAENVSIQGTPRAGQVLYVSYKYSDDNGDKEGQSIIKWFVNDLEYFTGKSITLSDDTVGKNIYAQVTPVSENYPKEGIPVKSNIVTVSSKPVYGGGGSQSSFKGSENNKPKEDEKNKTDVLNIIDKKDKFTDISGHWAKNIIEEMTDSGIVKGVDQDRFMPENYVTRAQFAQMISNLINIDNNTAEFGFNDIQTEDWYYEAVKNVSANGLMVGSNELFRPDDYITREEICVVIKNMSVLKELYNTTTVRADIDDYDEIHDWAQEAVNFAYKTGIVNGKSEKMFYPQDNATRAESLVMLQRFINLTGGQV